jgi:hypothetical protein
MRVLGLGLIVAAIAIPGAIDAATRITPVHPERERMSETRRRDSVLNDLNSILTGPSSPTSIATEPYAASVEGLCQRDVVQLQYSSRWDGTREHRLRPIGIGVSVQYHYLGSDDDRSWSNRQKSCEQLAGQKIYWAFAEDDHYAAGALATLMSTVSDVRGNQKFAVDCDGLNARDITTSCADIFLAAADQISAISRRLGRKDEDYEFTSSPYQFTIMRTYSPLITGGYSTAIKIRYQEIVVT